MHTTVFSFGEGSPFINSRRPVKMEIQDRLMWQAIRLAKPGNKVFKDGLVIYTPLPAYLDKPTTLEVYWDFKIPEESESH
ncbi:hypothetical protein [uncultured Pontibacter sp.]|uniref:hypothetical protein n=1 Tax=uncultured Pontibacter sp. TaxID=453356 RepID=UPI0026126E0B|nr:hypothetical protein [uncultured Pontibacter sp.]